MTVCVPGLAGFVDSFEEACARGDRVTLDDFLPPPDHPLRLAVLRELVCIDLEHHWLRGQAKPIEDYQRRYPELFEDHDAVREVLFEEYRLRQQANALDQKSTAIRPDLPVSPGKGARSGSEGRKPEAPARVSCSLAGASGFPAVGEDFEGFRLVRELGQGAFARVYLAEQAGLANRLVVLKIARSLFDESQTLAQLQHTHIVPIYSAHISRPSGQAPLQALCMPCLGVVTLADILQQIRRGPDRPSRGQDLLAIAQRVREAKGFPAATSELAVAQNWHSLTAGSFVEVVLRLGAALADGLTHAHDRGVLHRDLKPANVLLTDDGRPMLLDFNLAEDVKQRHGANDLRIGGTLPYMPPEQLEAFMGQPRTLDGRADVFALGAVLFELLTGQPPCPVSPGPTDEVIARLLVQRRRPVDPGCFNSELSPAVRAIIRHCLEPDPARRYASARELQEDLERQLRQQPLRHIREPSLAERLGKWLRRHPRLVSSGSISFVAGALVLVVSGLAVVRGRQLARAEAQEYARAFRGQAQQVGLVCLAGQPGDPAHLERCEQRCRELLTPYLSEGKNPIRLDLLSEAVRRDLHDEVGYLLLLWARVRSLRTSHREALELNQQAERFFSSPPLVLLRQRIGLLEALGEHEQARSASEGLAGMSPQGPRDLVLQAAGKRREGKHKEAMRDLQSGLADDPGNFWLWYDLGLCQEQLGQDTDASHSYTTCLALAPDAVPARFRRGLAYLRLRDHARALADLDGVLALEPDLLEARINRALARAGVGQVHKALADLDFVLARPTPYTRVWFLRAFLRRQVGDNQGAARDQAEGLQREPQDELSWVARAYARISTAPKDALADLDQALALNPSSRSALQNKAHILADRLGRPAEAILVLTRLLELRPDDVEARAARGVLYARLQRQADALVDARTCLSAKPSAGVLYRLGCLYALLSRQNDEYRPQALSYLQSALLLGYPASVLATDRDLDPIRQDPAFQRLLASSVTERGRP